MQILGLTSSGSVRLGIGPALNLTKPTSDTVAMSMSPETFSSLVKQAAEMPEVRQNLVDAYKARIQSGQYPDPAAVEGLIRLMGGTWVRQANDLTL